MAKCGLCGQQLPERNEPVRQDRFAGGMRCPECGQAVDASQGCPWVGEHADAWAGTSEVDRRSGVRRPRGPALGLQACFAVAMGVTALDICVLPFAFLYWVCNFVMLRASWPLILLLAAACVLHGMVLVAMYVVFDRTRKNLVAEAEQRAMETVVENPPPAR